MFRLTALVTHSNTTEIPLSISDFFAGVPRKRFMTLTSEDRCPYRYQSRFQLESIGADQYRFDAEESY